MESIFIFIVVIMFILAITDLIVGVSNDAVNFLTSAIGSKAATFRQIMIIASVGIMFGAVFSGGMMEVARKGVFNPEFFTIEEIMFLFAAVMITDIILLDFYNTVALPTSTTVSIVFELLGSALAVSFFAVLGNGHTINDWGNYINGDRAVIIIVGIFISVIVAFALGWLVQYFTRLLVSFEYHKSMRTFGAIFGSASVALILIFIILKGLKGIPFISDEALEFLKDSVGWVALAGFVISFISFQLFIGKKGFSVYKFVTLLGTFALAMAFASNDLVNFVGVPIASYDSYMIWKDSGIAADQFKMTSLAEPVQTNTIFLFAAGVVMTLTLWFSRKAKSVIKTSVNLGRQEEGAERFAPNEYSRGMVKAAMTLTTFVNKLIPPETLKKIDRQFIDTTKDKYKDTDDRPAFDMVRASVNLIVAAGIILAATSLKLPLSTTFVSFMVLMGTSLADKAWAQGSAVYRISGVFTVVGGWFLTAIIALTVSMIFASLLISFKGYALVSLVIIAILLIFRNQIFYRHHRIKAEENLEMADKWFKSDFMDIEAEVREKLIKILGRIDLGYNQAIEALIAYDRKALKEYTFRLDDFESTNDLYKVKITQQIKDVPEQYQEGGKILMFVYDFENELLSSLGNIIRSCERHVSNLHPKLQEEQVMTLTGINEDVKNFMGQILLRLTENRITRKGYKKFKAERKGLIHKIEEGVSEQIGLARSKNLSGKNSELILTILFSNKDLVISCSQLVKLFYKIKSSSYTSNMLDKLLDDT